VRLLRQTLTETLLLSGAGAIVGLVLVRWATQAFTTFAPRNIPRLQEIAPDWRVAAFTTGVAILTGVLIGLVPAFAGSRAESGPLKDAGRDVVSTSGRRTRSALIAAEVALAVVLTIGAGLLVRSFTALLAVDPGFRSEGLLTLQITLPARIATADARRAFYRDLFAALESLPGVERVGGTTRLPLGSTNLTTRVAVEGRRNTPDEMPEVSFRRALHDYFPAMGVPVLRGRSLGPDDGPNAPPVVVINQALARRLFGNDEPVGKHVKLGSDPATPWSTVAGVVGNIHHSALDEPPAPEIYLSSLTTPPVAPFIVLRTTTDPAALAETVRAALRTLDKDLAAYDLRTMTQIRSAAMSERRFIVMLAAIFGLIAVTLAAVGVYGVMALVVTERTREMGVRLALGAAPGQVLLLIVRQGVAVAGAGIAIGVAASIALTPLMANQLFGVAPTDTATMAAAPALLLAVAVMACVVPARRAMRVDPVSALRFE
jgi:putative ABC transport system permease protein